MRSLVAIKIILATNAKHADRTTPMPSYIKVCHRSDPGLNTCVKTAINNLRPHLIKGMPELGIPPCEPLIIKEMIFNKGSGSITLKSKYTNITLHGPTKFQIEDVKVEVNKKRLLMNFFLPELRMTNNYAMNGKMLMVPIRGTGYSEGNYTNINVSSIIQSEHVMKYGKTYYHVKDFSFKLNVGHASTIMDNLFNGDKKLGDTMNKFLNENWKIVAKEAMPHIEKKIGTYFKEFANKIFDKFPLDEILPP